MNDFDSVDLAGFEEECGEAIAAQEARSKVLDDLELEVHRIRYVYELDSRKEDQLLTVIEGILSFLRKDV